MLVTVVALVLLVTVGVLASWLLLVEVVDFGHVVVVVLASCWWSVVALVVVVAFASLAVVVAHVPLLQVVACATFG